MAKKAYAGNDKNIRSVRWEEIRRIIKERPVSTQQDLLKELNVRGYMVTQGTVSRDIRDMHLAKVNLPGGGSRYQEPENIKSPAVSSQFNSLFSSAVIRVDSALNQVVVRCYAGMANALCAAMDSLLWEGVLGTIAGDDTILVITDSQETALNLAEKLNDLRK